MTQLSNAVKEAKEKGEVLVLTDDDGKNFYFKKPGKPDVQRYLATTMKKKLAQAAQNLVMDLAIDPSKDDLEKMFSEKPGRMVAMCQALTDAVGLTEEFNVKKA